MGERRVGHSKLVLDGGSFKTVDPHPPLRHTHEFEEILSREDGFTRRCRCGARLWEPTSVLDPAQAEPRHDLSFHQETMARLGALTIRKPI